MNRIERIQALLHSSLTPAECVVDDESHLHAGHAGAASGGGHYRLRLVSAHFEGLNKVARHRLVYDALHEMMPQEIHALAMTLHTPGQAASG